MEAGAWWLALPAGATLLAIAWTIWVSRPRRPADVSDTLGEYERFKAAFSDDGRDPKDPRSG